MQRPELALDNYKALYDYYEARTPNRTTAAVAHYILGHLYRPEIHYADGAEQETIEHANDDGTFLVAAKHVDLQDPFVEGGVVYIEEAWKHFNGNVRITAKQEIFGWHNAIRTFLDSFGAVPVWRTKDDERANLRRLAAIRWSEMNIAFANRGNNVVLFPEGTRNDENLPIESGIGYIASGISKEVNMKYLPVAIGYRGEIAKLKKRPRRDYITNLQKVRQPVFYSGRPCDIPETKPEVIEMVADTLADCYRNVKEILAQTEAKAA